jgi:hypothetical protein
MPPLRTSGGVRVVGLRLLGVALLEPCQQARRHRLWLAPALTLGLPPTLLDGVVQHRVRVLTVDRLAGFAAKLEESEIAETPQRARGRKNRLALPVAGGSPGLDCLDHKQKLYLVTRRALSSVPFEVSGMCARLRIPYRRKARGGSALLHSNVTGAGRVVCALAIRARGGARNRTFPATPHESAGSGRVLRQLLLDGPFAPLGYAGWVTRGYARVRVACERDTQVERLPGDLAWRLRGGGSAPRSLSSG